MKTIKVFGIATKNYDDALIESVKLLTAKGCKVTYGCLDSESELFFNCVFGSEEEITQDTLKGYLDRVQKMIEEIDEDADYDVQFSAYEYIIHVKFKDGAMYEDYMCYQDIIMADHEVTVVLDDEVAIEICWLDELYY